MGVIAELERCLAAGGIAVFPSDTVYGLACDPTSPAAVRRLYALKGRPPDKPVAVMAFSVDLLPPLGPRTTAAARAVLPGAVTLLVPNPEGRFPLAGGGPLLGLRVPDVPLLAGVDVPLLQTSANHAGEPDARRLADVPAALRDGADLVIDGGDLPGVASTVVDLGRYEDEGLWTVVRPGAVPSSALEDALGPSTAAR